MRINYLIIAMALEAICCQGATHQTATLKVNILDDAGKAIKHFGFDPDGSGRQHVFVHDATNAFPLPDPLDFTDFDENSTYDYPSTPVVPRLTVELIRSGEVLEEQVVTDVTEVFFTVAEPGPYIIRVSTIIQRDGEEPFFEDGALEGTTQPSPTYARFGTDEKGHYEVYRVEREPNIGGTKYHYKHYKRYTNTLILESSTYVQPSEYADNHCDEVTIVIPRTKNAFFHLNRLGIASQQQQSATYEEFTGQLDFKIYSKALEKGIDIIIPTKSKWMHQRSKSDLHKFLKRSGSKSVLLTAFGTLTYVAAEGPDSLLVAENLEEIGLDLLKGTAIAYVVGLNPAISLGATIWTVAVFTRDATVHIIDTLDASKLRTLVAKATFDDMILTINKDRGLVSYNIAILGETPKVLELLRLVPLPRSRPNILHLDQLNAPVHFKPLDTELSNILEAPEFNESGLAFNKLRAHLEFPHWSDFYQVDRRIDSFNQASQLDCTPPTVIITSPQKDSTYQDSLTVQATITDETIWLPEALAGPIAYVKAWVDRDTIYSLSELGLNTYGTTMPLRLPDGNHTLYVEAGDRWGNRTLKKTTFNIDTKPIIEPIPPKELEIWNGGHFYSIGPNGKVICVAADRTVRIYNMETQKQLFIPSLERDFGSNIESMALNHDATRLAIGTGYRERVINEIDGSTVTPRHLLTPSDLGISDAQAIAWFSGKFVYGHVNSKTKPTQLSLMDSNPALTILDRVNVSDNPLHDVISLARRPTTFEFVAGTEDRDDGLYTCFYGSVNGNRISIHNKRLEIAFKPETIRFSPDGEEMVVSGRDGLAVYNSSSLNERRPSPANADLALGNRGNIIAFDAEGEIMAVSQLGATTITFFNTIGSASSWNQREIYQADGPVRQLRFKESGSELWAIIDSKLRTVDVNSLLVPDLRVFHPNPDTVASTTDSEITVAGKVSSFGQSPVAHVELKNYETNESKLATINEAGIFVESIGLTLGGNFLRAFVPGHELKGVPLSVNRLRDEAGPNITQETSTHPNYFYGHVQFSVSFDADDGAGIGLDTDTARIIIENAMGEAVLSVSAEGLKTFDAAVSASLPNGKYQTKAAIDDLAGNKSSTRVSGFEVYAVDGNVTGTGKTSVQDIVHLNNFLNERTQIPAYLQPVADLDKDGSITTTDVERIAEAIVTRKE